MDADSLSVQNLAAVDAKACSGDRQRASYRSLLFGPTYSGLNVSWELVTLYLST